MVNKFNIGDLVIFQNKTYIVKSILPMNPNILSDPFVCGLVPIEKPNKIEQLLVREQLLTKVEPKTKEKK